MRFRPAIIVLAAGHGTRFKAARHKLEQTLLGSGGTNGRADDPADGPTVFGSTLRHAVETQLPVVAITTAALAPVAWRHLARRDVVVLADAEAARGMGHSIATGVSERSGAPGWLVLPGDMPLITSDSILAVAAALENQTVVYAQHQGRRGHPVGFSAEIYSELVMLSGDEGARRLVARYPAQGVEVPDPGVLVDVDTVADLDAARRAAAAAASGR